MKSIKTFKIFDSVEKPNHFGIDIEDIKWYFTDFIDDGLQIRISENSKLIDLKTIERPMGHHTLGEIKYIKLDIWKLGLNYRTFMNTQEFEDIILEANDRLIENGLFIHDIIPYGSRLSILIYREIDKKYLQ